MQFKTSKLFTVQVNVYYFQLVFQWFVALDTVKKTKYYWLEYASQSIFTVVGNQYK